MAEKEATPIWATSAAGQQRVPANDFMRIYSNNFVLAMSTWDMALTFGEIVGERKGEPLIEEKVKITMSVAHGKAIYQLLGQHLGVYEKLFGEIKIADVAQMKAQLETASEEAASLSEPAPEAKSE